MNNKYKILMIEDEQNISTFVKTAMEANDYHVLLASTCQQGVMMFSSHMPDLVILDLGLPDRDGLEFISAVRESSAVPIIVLSARTMESDKVAALDMGADDYLTKPFSMEELTYRIEAIMRRLATRKNNQRTTYPLGSLTFDTQKQTLSNETTNIKLTTKECELLTLLCLNVNNILQRDYALKAIWVDDNYFNARSMDVYITKLRKHLKDDPNVEIINVHGKGYKLVAPNFD